MKLKILIPALLTLVVALPVWGVPRARTASLRMLCGAISPATLKTAFLRM